MSPKGKQTALCAFAGGNDGSNPQAGLLLASNGKIYGTTYAGGSAGAHHAVR